MKLPPRVVRRHRSPWQVHRSVLFALFMRELRTRLGGRWLGMLWLVGEPLAHVLLMLAIFTYVRNVSARHTDFPLFLVTGLLPFFMFRNLSLRLADAIASNRGLFSYRQVKPIDTLVARASVETVLHSAVYAAALLLLAWWGLPALPHAPLELMVASINLVMLGLGIGFVLAVACHGRPRLRAAVGLVFLPLYLASGVIFPIESTPPEVRAWLMLNPVAHLIDLSRTFFIAGHFRMAETSMAYSAAWALVATALGLSLYRVDRHRLITRD